MKILGNRLLLSKVDEEKKDGFQVAEVQDSFVYKGRVEQVANLTVMKEIGLETYKIKVGDIVLFAKYSPSTQDVEIEGRKLKIVEVEDILAIL